jgi:hypothetical protein
MPEGGNRIPKRHGTKPVRPWKPSGIRDEPEGGGTFVKHGLRWMLLTTFLVAGLLSARAQERTYKVLTADIPFKFDVGNRTFHSGRYQFIMVGTGLLAMRDGHSHTVASLVARPVESASPALYTRLVFLPGKKRLHLAQVWLENHTVMLEVMGEELAFQQPAPPPDSLPVEVFSLTGRNQVPRMRH